MTNEEIVQMLLKHDNALESFSLRLDKAEGLIEEIRKLTTTTQLIAQKQNNIEEKLDSLSESVQVLEAKPRDRWDKVISTLITVAVTAIATAVLTHAQF